MPTDSVNHWLRAVDAEGLVLARTRVSGDWGFSIGRRDAAVFHFVSEGHACLRIEDAEPIEIAAGDLVVLPRGAPHVIGPSPECAVMPLERFLASHNGVFTQADVATTLVCGAIMLDRHMLLPAIRSLPSMVRLTAEGESSTSPVGLSLELLRREVENKAVGNEIVVRHLVSILFVYILREWAETAPGRIGDWFSALRNPHVARALACIHNAPAGDWTLARLAVESGLSRSAFARQFQILVGEPPHSYLIRWRMGVAAQLLEQSSLQVSEIAVRVGYQSEFSFSRAFRKARGMSPMQARKRAVSGAPGR